MASRRWDEERPELEGMTAGRVSGCCRGGPTAAAASWGGGEGLLLAAA